MVMNESRQGSTLVLELEGWLDTEASLQLQKRLGELDGSVTSLVIDCSALEFISSGGLRQFVDAHKRMNGALTLKSVSDEIMEIITMTGLAKRLHFEA